MTRTKAGVSALVRIRRAPTLSLACHNARRNSPAALRRNGGIRFAIPPYPLSNLRTRFENIGRDQDDGVGAVVAVPMNGLAVLPGGVARMKGLRGTVVTDDRVGSLHEINDGRP